MPAGAWRTLAALTWAVTGSGLGVGLPVLLLTTDHHAAAATAATAGDGPARGSDEEDAVDAWCRAHRCHAGRLPA